MSAQKKREFEPVARLTLGGLRIAQLVETSNAKPTPNMPMESPSYTILYNSTIGHTYCISPGHSPLLCL